MFRQFGGVDFEKCDIIQMYRKFKFQKASKVSSSLEACMAFTAICCFLNIARCENNKSVSNEVHLLIG